MRHPFAILDVFTDRSFSGNQLAVVFDADGLAPARMQAVAAEFGFSETTFVQRPEGPGHDARVRIFTPKAEMPFAGHPTVGTALAMAWRGLVPAGKDRIVLGENAGPVPVAFRRDGDDGRAIAAEFTAPLAPALGPAADPAAAAAALGLLADDLVTAGGLPRDASCGAAFLIVELVGLDALARARLTGTTGVGLSGAAVEGLFLFTRETGGDPAVDLRARMYAPAHGVAEDPATGSAAAALGGLLATTEGVGEGATRRWRIAQGVEMGRPSLIEVGAHRAADGTVAVTVAGAAVLVAEGSIEIPAGPG